ncbi:MAG: LiaF transmembrane domain-containing protein [Acidobacteriaceae bacterium]
MNCANHPDVERTAFCQNCGKPVCRECMRQVGQAVFCEPCLEAKLGASAYAGAAAAPGGSYTASGSAGGVNYTYNGTIPPPPPPGGPSPTLAALLGMIPGVGAMYNGQFVKALVHLVVFAVLVSLSDKASFFGIMIGFWFFYQVIDAYQTAKARRDGDPLPNPFGLNDLDERLGFRKAGAAPAAPGTTAGVGGAPPAATYAAPPPPPPYTPPAYAAPSPYASTAMPPVPPLAPEPFNPMSPAPGSNLPIGAIVLIGLGIFFLLGTMNIFSSHWMAGGWPFLLIGLGIWLFIRKMQDIGVGLADDGSATYRWYVVRCLKGPAFLMLVGVLALLDSWHVLSWGSSWPFFIILLGLLVIAERITYGNAQAESYAAQQMPAAGPSTQPTTNQSDSPHPGDAANEER